MCPSSYRSKIGGPVQYRWMYPIERLLRRFKCYVRNKSRPDGSIAEGYIIEECMYFCSKYLHEIETKVNQPERNDDAGNNDYKGLSIFASSGIPLVNMKREHLTKIWWIGFVIGLWICLMKAMIKWRKI